MTPPRSRITFLIGLTAAGVTAASGVGYYLYNARRSPNVPGRQRESTYHSADPSTRPSNPEDQNQSSTSLDLPLVSLNFILARYSD